MSDLDYEFRAEIWVYTGEKAVWHFLALPKDASWHIKHFCGDAKRGWGSVRVEAIIGNTRWKTSIFPDKKLGAYILPLKAEIRKKEVIKKGDAVEVKLAVNVE